MYTVQTTVDLRRTPVEHPEHESARQYAITTAFVRLAREYIQPGVRYSIEMTEEFRPDRFVAALVFTVRAREL